MNVGHLASIHLRIVPHGASFLVEGDDDTVLRAPIPAYLIEHTQRLALFDTGLAPRVRQKAPSFTPGVQTLRYRHLHSGLSGGATVIHEFLIHKTAAGWPDRTSTHRGHLIRARVAAATRGGYGR